MDGLRRTFDLDGRSDVDEASTRQLMHVASLVIEICRLIVADTARFGWNLPQSPGSELTQI